MRAGRGATFAGQAGEDIAARLYRAEGGRIIARRWRCAEGEIDLVVETDGTLVFVEVKARRSTCAAAEALAPAQVRRLRAAIARFLAATGGEGRPLRLDVVLIDRTGRAARLKNAIAFDEW